MVNDKPTLSQTAIDALRQGRKIEAIKLLREDAGLGLKEAKETVEAYERLHPTPAHASGPEADSIAGRIFVSAIVTGLAIAIYRAFAEALARGGNREAFVHQLRLPCYIHRERLDLEGGEPHADASLVGV